MSERAPNGYEDSAAEEHGGDEISHEHAPAHHKLHEQHKSAESGKHEQHNLKEQVEAISRKAKQEAESAKDTAKLHEKHHRESVPKDQPSLVNGELKNVVYQRTLTRVRKDLSAPERTLSKVIHQPTVESLSEIGGKTVARPSGVLVGGICAFIGSSSFLWIAKHYGYSFNFMLFALFFAGGFALGLAIELGYRLAQRARG